MSQAYLKRGLPRSEMHDNGSAMRAAEIVAAGKRLGIEHRPTLSYSAYQKGKQEKFWDVVERQSLEEKTPGSSMKGDVMNNRTPERWPRLDPGDVIPDDWSTEQTLLVYDFLLRISTAIFDRYEHQMLAGIKERTRPSKDIDNENVNDENTALHDESLRSSTRRS